MKTTKKKVAAPKKVAAKPKTAKAKKTKVDTNRKPKVEEAYVATIEANEQVWEFSGATALDAFKAINVPVMLLKTKVIVRLACGPMSSQQLMLAIQFRRFLNNKVAREIWAKRLELRFT